MPIIRPCAHRDCQILTMGEFCIEHEGDDVAEFLVGEAAAAAADLRRVVPDADRGAEDRGRG
jgi:hypothetical protein